MLSNSYEHLQNLKNLDACSKSWLLSV